MPDTASRRRRHRRAQARFASTQSPRRSSCRPLVPVRASDAVGGNAPSRTLDAPADLAELRAHHADAIRVRDETIADLRRRLDIATGQLGEALMQVRLLTDQRTAPRRTWWRWRR